MRVLAFSLGLIFGIAVLWAVGLWVVIGVFQGTGESRCCTRGPTPEAEAQRLLRQAICAHDDKTGGNDYQLCNTCGLMWDYRRETADAALERDIRKALTPTGQPTPPRTEDK